MWIVHLTATVLTCSGLLVGQPTSADPSAAVDELYRAGREELNRRGYENLERARESFLGAIALDSEFAPAHAGLAEAYALLGDYARAEDAALEAVELDESLARGHAALGFVRFHAHWDWSEAERELRTAVALDPSDALARHWYAIYLEAMGQNEKAIAEARTAFELEREVQAYALGLGYRLFWARRYDDAIAQLERVLERDGDVTSAHYFLARCHTEMGRLRQAEAALESARSLAPRDLNVAAAQGYLHARSGRRPEAATRLRELRRFSELGYPLATHMASIHATLGELDTALRWLERAHREHEGPLVWLKVDPRFDVLRSHPRFTALLAEMNLHPRPGPSNPPQERSRRPGTARPFLLADPRSRCASSRSSRVWSSSRRPSPDSGKSRRFGQIRPRSRELVRRSG